jgi:small subunit ribosomal protein S17
MSTHERHNRRKTLIGFVSSKMGDKIEVMETRPISRLKRWRVIRVVEAAVGAATAISETDVAAIVPTKTTKANATAAAKA